MTPLAEIALHKGLIVSGSDQAIGRNCQRLIKHGATIHEGHRKENLPNGKYTLVYSSAISDDNPELLGAKKQGFEVWHRSQFLKYLIGDKKLIAVAGTHGKTSTTAIISHMLEFCDFKPTSFIGGEVLGKEAYSYFGDGDYFVAELDESDGSFLNFNPYISIVNNIDLDHLDFYKNLDGIKDAFKIFLNNTDPEGLSILNWDNIHCHELAQDLDSNLRLAFGKRIGCDIRGLSFKTNNSGSSFKAAVERDLVDGVAPLIGDHNFQNILCALTVARALELPINQAVESLASLPGVGRRLNCLFSSDAVKVFDDYAHNPGKISACVSAIKESHPDSHLAVIFQPHRYSRMKTMYNEFMQSFDDADTLLLLPIFSAGEQDTGSYSPHDFAHGVASCSEIQTKLYSHVPNPAELVSPFEGKQKVVYLSVGAGDVYQLSHSLRDYFNGQEKREKE